VKPAFVFDPQGSQLEISLSVDDELFLDLRLSAAITLVILPVVVLS